MGIFSFVKAGGKRFATIKSVKPSKNIKEFTKHKEDVAKTTEKYNKGLTEEGKINVRKGTSRVLSKISKILKREKKMGGGMMGRRMGYSQGSNGKPVSRSKNPGLLKMSKSEKGKTVVKKFGYNPNRIVAKKGGKA